MTTKSRVISSKIDLLCTFSLYWSRPTIFLTSTITFLAHLLQPTKSPTQREILDITKTGYISNFLQITTPIWLRDSLMLHLSAMPSIKDTTRKLADRTGGGVLGSIFAGYVPLASPKPYPIIVYSVANYRPHVGHFWANILQTPTCQNLLTPEIPQMCNPILVTLLAPIENATPL